MCKGIGRMPGSMMARPEKFCGQYAKGRGRRTKGGEQKIDDGSRWTEDTPVEHPKGTRFNGAGRAEDGKRQKTEDR